MRSVKILASAIQYLFIQIYAGTSLRRLQRNKKYALRKLSRALYHQVAYGDDSMTKDLETAILMIDGKQLISVIHTDMKELMNSLGNLKK